MDPEASPRRRRGPRSWRSSVACNRRGAVLTPKGPTGWKSFKPVRRSYPLKEDVDQVGVAREGVGSVSLQGLRAAALGRDSPWSGCCKGGAPSRLRFPHGICPSSLARVFFIFIAIFVIMLIVSLVGGAAA